MIRSVGSNNKGQVKHPLALHLCVFGPNESSLDEELSLRRRFLITVLEIAVFLLKAKVTLVSPQSCLMSSFRHPTNVFS